MKSSNKILFIIFLFIIGINFVSAKEKVTFSKCVDGDTIKVLINGKENTIRMLAIDTPESVHPTKGTEYYGKESSEYTCNKVSNANKIELEYDNNSDKKDKYDRVLAWIWVDDILLQDELVKNGYAEVAYLYGDYKYIDTLKDHQSVAEASKIGIWDEEARKEFDSNSSTKEDNNTNKSDSGNYIDLENMSTSDIIIIIVVLVIGAILGPTIKKGKRKIKKYTK